MTDETIFANALEQADPAARAAYLGQACAGDPERRKRVEGLLAAHDNAGTFLARPAVAAPHPDEVDTRASGRPDSTDEQVNDALAYLQASPRLDALGRIGHYDVLEVLGRGGFGVVFRAFDEVLQRVVAVKVLAPQMAATSPARKRFIREAQSSAKIRHQNVVQVHAVEAHPLPYLVMEYVPGESLQKRLDRTGPLDVPEVLRIGRQLAEGLAAAHEAGLIHRDIKPANVLIESSPQQCVKLTDFGLARAADDASITQSGVVAGTPMYMAPEQAKGEALDHRTDLFSLGSVLYVMCSGRPPFRASGTMAVLSRVREDHPRPIRELIPEVPVWLCRIVEKLHAKNPADRFQTAREVADLLADCEKRLRAHEEPKDGTRLPGIDPVPRRAGRLRRAAVILIGFGVTALTALGVHALAVRPDGQTHREDTPSIPPPVAAPTWPESPGEVRRLVGHTNPVRALAFSPDGRHVLSGSRFYSPDGHHVLSAHFPGGDQTVRLWDVASGTELRRFVGHTGSIESVAFSPDGTRAFSAGGGDYTARVWEVTSCRELGRLEGHTDVVSYISASPDGRYAVTASQDRTMRVWDLTSFKERKRFTGHEQFIAGATFSRDGRRIASGSWDGTARLWDIASGRELHRFEGHERAVWQVAFSPDGAHVLSGGDDGTVRVWDAETGREVRRMTGHTLQVFSLSVSRDGRHVLSGSGDGTVRLWEVATGKEVYQFRGSTEPVWAVALSPDGRFAVCGGGGGLRNGEWVNGSDWAIRLWRLPDFAAVISPTSP